MAALIKRRAFVKYGLKFGLLVPYIGLSACQSQKKDKEDLSGTSKDKLDILILGGTSFLGPHQIAYAMQKGHKITTFTRGQTKPIIHKDLFDQVTMLIGDRNDNLSALEDKEWDVVIDNSGHNVE
jgi:2'-hydroxyisoflavone reductase